ncbi:hypothetical protein B0I35DRAFT_174809 [Stachybotrys elegans]|uniref:Translation initiation factor IF-2, mitochondrial n=1 Tax=Stachybotrys elegans TaxID=80388 RepID=A0A8K0SWS1_9HYPO|nr:hypothetical protein B0I35DRAFT_174809 [Stachybotrys elegans]
MLRSRACNERSTFYVCTFCRHQSSARPLRHGSASILTSSSPGALAARASASNLGRRLVSTTSPLYNSKDGSPSGGFPGKSFGSGGFGSGGFASGSFGSFTSRSTSNGDSSSSNLLAHELEARQRTAAAKANRPNPSAPRKQANSGDDRSQQSQRPRKGPNHNQGNRGKNESTPRQINQVKGEPNLNKGWRSKAPQETPVRLAQEKSKAVMSDILKPKSTPQDSAFSPDSSSSQVKTAPGSKWGAFSQKEVQLSQEETMTKPTSIWSDSSQTATQTKEPARGRKQVTETAPTSAPGDFWDELEQRVDKKVSEMQAADKKAREESAAQQVAIKSRWDVERERGSDRQSKKAKKGGRNDRRDSDHEMSDRDVERWEKQQQRKAEKEQRRLEALLEPQAMPIFIPEYISVANLANALKQRTRTFLTELAQMGFEDVTVDTVMTGETAALVAAEYGFEPTVDDGSLRDLRPRPPPEDASALPVCPPVVTIMGHVDHGKTTLLDWLRKSSVAAQEHGGITQHIGAFIVKMSSGKTITFLDTPGHAAFLSMRQRGANVTNIVVLVVAADDSVMPQTLEALRHARAAKVPIIVAITKVDKEDARIDQVKADLARHQVEIEDFGGDVQVVCVSGKTGQGMGDLEENIVTLAEILDVRAETDGMAEGWILESNIKQDGRAATVLVKRGTLRLGDVIVAGKTWGKVRLMRNEAGMEIEEAPPGTPVEILGWRDIPAAGDQIIQAPDEGAAKTAVEYRQEMEERQEHAKQVAELEQRQREKAAAEAAEAADEEEGNGEPEVPGIKMQNVVVKADTGGSVEAICGAIQELGNNEVRARVLRSSTGQIFEADIDHAAVTNSIILNFHNPIQPNIKSLAAAAKVKILDHTVIYHMIDDVKNALSDLLPPLVSHRVIGEADVLQIFPINIKRRVFRNIAGCRVRNGTIKKSSSVKVIRKGEVVYDGKIDTLKHVKKDVNEMGKGTECGIGLADFEGFKVDDQIQTYEEITEKRHL